MDCGATSLWRQSLQIAFRWFCRAAVIDCALSKAESLKTGDLVSHLDEANAYQESSSVLHSSHCANKSLMSAARPIPF